MAAPWVILGRVLRVGFVPGDVEAEVEEEHEAQAHHAAAAYAHGQAQAAQPEHAAAVHAEEAVAQAEQAAAAAEPDFTLPVALPRRVTVVSAGRGAHPDPENPDKYPYIVAAGPLSILAHFAGAPFRGTYFDDYPHETHLVLVRAFVTAGGGLTTASAVRVPDRAGRAPVLRNVGSVGLYSEDEGDYRIVELQLHKGSERASLVCFNPAKLANRGYADWYVKDVEHPMAEENREFAPHGAVTLDSTIWWFDLSWGALSCDLDEGVPDLLFHHVPDGRALAEATPDIHTRRCVTVSRNKVRYVEIITAGGAATLCMWTRLIGPDGWTWYVKYAMNFENVWDDDSYKETGLPRDVPVLAAVCPSNPGLVYFALEQRLFGVDVPAHRVVHNEAYELVNIPGPPQPSSSRYVLPWNLPPEIAQGKT
ncbi:hypothetical protein GQ55_4G246800 [Panicum hallii var. hallii]|uniref:DUF1618 domain-containing protein n=1 Tax=Panicum hallii var. hallii TaxID=1504633 RepID=A0A2T7DZW9_9POAL|nr:hypothetical protein GQ55_4G246800 [Panicum hallii var. hallii]